MKKQDALADKLLEDLFQAVSKTMKEDGISQAEVARRTGADRTNVNKVLCKRAPTGLLFMLRVADAVGLDVELKVRRKK
jgi:transcriptional regulator with XRE-family HTH domain